MVKGNKLTRETFFLLFFLYSFCNLAQQNITHTQFEWEGDTDRIRTAGNTITTDNMEDEIRIFAPFEGKKETTWSFGIDIPDKNNGEIYFYPLLNSTSQLSGETCVKILSDKQNNWIGLYNYGLDEYKIPKGYGKTIGVRITLDEDGLWDLTIIDDGKEKRPYWIYEIPADQTEGTLIGLRFVSMPNVTIRDFTVENQDGDEKNDEEDPKGDGEEENPDDPPLPQKQGCKFGDLVISEVMANPANISGLPEAEYIELHNRTDSAIDLQKWTLRYDTKSYELPSAMLDPHGFIILSHGKHAAEWEKARIDKRADMEKFPTLANSGKRLFICDKEGTIVAYTHYTDKRYHDDFRKNGGFSIERIDCDNTNDTGHNWTACLDLAGGTPGKANSAQGTCLVKEPAAFLYRHMIGNDTLRLVFSSPLSRTTAEDANTFILSDAAFRVVEAIPDATYLSHVDLVLSKASTEDTQVSIEIDGLQGIDGTPALCPQQIPVALPIAPRKDLLFFNEILFDADGSSCEFVEIFNASDRPVELQPLKFAILQSDNRLGKSSDISKTPRIIEAHTYLACTSDTTILQQRWAAMPWQAAFCSLPALSNDGGTVVLILPNAETVDAAVFSSKIYPSIGQSARGISAEKINPLLSSAQLANWLPASFNADYATPGRENSQYKPLDSPAQDELFRLEHDFLTPDGDGIDDAAIIHYVLPDGGYVLNMTVYSSNGREISRPLRRETAATQGVITWDGRNDGGDIVPTGIYILLIEAVNEAGDCIRRKLAVAVNS